MVSWIKYENIKRSVIAAAGIFRLREVRGMRYLDDSVKLLFLLTPDGLHDMTD